MVVVDHDESWAGQFLMEKNRLERVFSDVVQQIHHIGSTAIPFIKAKPIIDILIEVSSIEEVDLLSEQMKGLGYEGKGENGIPDRRYFQKGGDERTHHVHCYPVGHPQVRRHLLFRDYLIANPETAQQYSELKEQLSMKFLYDSGSYVKGKEMFVRQMDAEALRWDSINNKLENRL